MAAHSSKALHTRQLAACLARDCCGALYWGHRKAKLSGRMAFCTSKMPLHLNSNVELFSSGPLRVTTATTTIWHGHRSTLLLVDLKAVNGKEEL